MEHIEESLIDYSKSISFTSRYKIRLIEFYDNNNGEVCCYKEFNGTDRQPTVRLPMEELPDFENQSGTVWDERGNKTNFIVDKKLFALF